MAVSALNATHEAIVARYHDVDPVYGEQREHRLLGFVLFLISDVVLFSAFIFAYLYLRNSVPNWPPINKDGVQLPRFDLALAPSTPSCSSVRARRCTSRWRAGSTQQAGLQHVDSRHDRAGHRFPQRTSLRVSRGPITWAGSTMGATFFTLTGMHGFHVFVGIIYLSCSSSKRTKASTPVPSISG